MQLTIIPLTHRQACDFISKWHRHHKPPVGEKFALGALDCETSQLVGVIVVGRPVSRAYDNGLTAEVTRSCSDGTKNVNSFLYSAAWRVAREMGYLKLITYTQKTESGISLKAAGWKVIAERDARKSWAESSVKLKFLRDPIGCGGIARTLWSIGVHGKDKRFNP
jgi:hypothetical protein